MRLRAFLTEAGACSRRKALAWIQSGKVLVNGRACLEPSFRVDPSRDSVSLGGKPLSLKKKAYILLNKPKGVTTTAYDRFAARTVLDILPKDLRHLHPVGRLDKDTTGLLLLTNDGALAHGLTHPSFGVEKVYRVRFSGPVATKVLSQVEKGVLLDGEKTAPCRIKRLGDREVEVILHEGRKRQIRRMFAQSGHPVQELARIKQGPLSLGGLKAGEWRFLAPEEVAGLYRAVGPAPGLT